MFHIQHIDSFDRPELLPYATMRRSNDQRATLIGLGLNKIGRTVVVQS